MFEEKTHPPGYNTKRSLSHSGITFEDQRKDALQREDLLERGRRKLRQRESRRSKVGNRALKETTSVSLRPPIARKTPEE